MKVSVGWWGLALAACASPVRIEGQIASAFKSGEPAAGVTVSLRDASFEPYDEAVTAADGAFAVEAPRRSEIHLVVSGEGLVPTAFRGESGEDDAFVVPTGQLWAFSEAEAQAWRDDFLGCPGAEAASGMIVGTVWLDLAVEDITVGPPVADAFARVSDPEGTWRSEACYLDDEGAGVDGGALTTGDTGRFALFGIEEGPWVLTIGRYSGASTLLGRSTVYVPEDGAVVRLPALVPF